MRKKWEIINKLRYSVSTISNYCDIRDDIILKINIWYLLIYKNDC